MRTNGLVKELAASVPAAYAAVRAMDKSTKWFLDRQSEEATEREREVQPEFTTAVVARKAASMLDVELERDQAKELGKWLHRLVGVSGGPLAVWLMRRGKHPLTAGLATGLGLWVLLDEALNPIMGFSKPAPEYPIESHARGFVGHAVYGAALGGLLALARLVPPRSGKVAAS